MVMEVLLLFPVFLVLLLLSAQAALWYISDQAATAAATVGARDLATGDQAGWTTAAHDALGHDLGQPSFTLVTAPNGMSGVTVSGTAPQILPFGVHVSSTSYFVTQAPRPGA